MPTDSINGVRLYWQLTGQEDNQPMVLVHGSWGDHHNWDSVADTLSGNFRVITYDRRGHSQSERPPGQGNTDEDVMDLIALIEYLNIPPAHIVGNSFGAALALKAAAIRPDLFLTLVAHEPPLFGLIHDASFIDNILPVVNGRIEAVMDLIARGQNEQAAKLFVETIAFGQGAWDQLPQPVKETFAYNAPTWYDEIMDPGSLVMDTGRLTRFSGPALLTSGSASAPFFPGVVDEIHKAIPHAQRITFEGAGHVPHLSHPEEYVRVVTRFCLEHAGAQTRRMAL